MNPQDRNPQPHRARSAPLASPSSNQPLPLPNQSGLASGARGSAPASRLESESHSSSGHTSSASPGTRSRTSRWLMLGLVVMGLGTGGYMAMRADAPGTTESASSAYSLHQNADLSAPIRVSSADLDVARAAQPDMPARASEIIADVSGASPELQAAIAAHSVQYVTVRVFDTCSEDGDVVSLSTDTGATFGPFTISNAGSTVSIPVVGGRAPRITLHALKDGNGGITVGATTSMGTWYSGILPEGGTQIVSMIDR